MEERIRAEFLEILKRVLSDLHQKKYKNILKYVAQERACDRAQLEIEKVYVDDMIPDIYNNLINEGKNDIAEKVKPYVKKLRCGFPGYHCPGTCGHPRINREL